jgi:putative sterol carrier protein
MPDGGTENATLSGVDADELAKLVAQADDAQIAAGMQSENRKPVLDEIFKRMSEHVKPEKAAGPESVIHFKVLDRPDGGYDHYEVVVGNGTCTATDQPSRDARVTFRISAVDFIKLVSGNAAGPMLFMTGKLKIEGDLMYASQLTSLFTIPKGA